MDPQRLSALQLDALSEVGNIGAGHAATALSQLLGTAVGVTVPRVRLLSVTEVSSVFGGPENLVGAVYSRLLGDLSGGLLFVAPRTISLRLPMHSAHVPWGLPSPSAPTRRASCCMRRQCCSPRTSPRSPVLPSSRSCPHRLTSRST